MVSDRSVSGLTVTDAALLLSDGSRSGSPGMPPAATEATVAVFSITLPAIVKPATSTTLPTNDAVTIWLSATGPRSQVKVSVAASNVQLPGARHELDPGRQRVGHLRARRPEPGRAAVALAHRAAVRDREREPHVVADVGRLRVSRLGDRQIGDLPDADRRDGRVISGIGVHRRARDIRGVRGGGVRGGCADVTVRLIGTVVPEATVSSVHVIVCATRAAVCSRPWWHQGQAGRQRVGDHDGVGCARSVVGHGQRVDEVVADGQRRRDRGRAVALERLLADRDIGDGADQLVERGGVVGLVGVAGVRGDRRRVGDRLAGGAGRDRAGDRDLRGRAAGRGQRRERADDRAARTAGKCAVESAAARGRRRELARKRVVDDHPVRRVGAVVGDRQRVARRRALIGVRAPVLVIARSALVVTLMLAEAELSECRDLVWCSTRWRCWSASRHRR